MNISAKSVNKQAVCHVAHIKIRKLGFLYNRKCELECKHCLAECSPRESQKLDPLMCCERIDESAHLGIEEISFSGGEPLLYFDEILTLIKKAHDNGQKVTISTNAVWARNKKSAASKVKLLKEAGLNHMQISYGEFHRESGANIEQVKNAISECRKADIGVYVQRVIKSDWDCESISVGLELQRLKCDIHNIGLNQYGFARKYFPESNHRYIKTPLDKMPVCNGIGLLTCRQNGDILPCCGPGISDIEKNGSRYLELGNAYKDTLEESLKNAKDNLFLTILATTGIQGFKILSQKYDIDFSWPDEFAHLCDFCLFAAKNSKFDKWFTLVEKEREKILPQLYDHYRVLKKWGLNEVEIIMQD